VIRWLVFDLLCPDGTSDESYGKKTIVKGAPLLSTISYYFALIQKKTVKKAPQKLVFEAGTTLVQPNNTVCGYFVAAAARAIIDVPYPFSNSVLQDEDVDGVVLGTKKHMISMFKMRMQEEGGLVKGQRLSSELLPRVTPQRVTEKSETEDSADEENQKKRKRGSSKKTP
jgi:hypothetical protein